MSESTTRRDFLHRTIGAAAAASLLPDLVPAAELDPAEPASQTCLLYTSDAADE